MENRFSFRRGWDQLPRNKVSEAIRTLKKGLKIGTNPGLYKRINGKIEPRVSEKEFIEDTLVAYGIKRDKIWGDGE